MFDMSYYAQIEDEIPTASIERLLEIRDKALARGKGEEEILRDVAKRLRKGDAEAKIQWREDAAIIYHKNMQFVAACSLMLSRRYGELEEEE